MRLEKDYEDLLRLFNKNSVRYCIVGAFAVAFYGIPRYTKDIDILIEPSIENGKSILNALREFGFHSPELSEKDFTQKGTIVQLGYEPVRIDMMTSVEGVSFEEVWKNKAVGTYGREDVFFIGLEELIKSKKKANRKQDKADIEILSDLKGIKKRNIGT